jgi:glycerate kinase
MRIVLAPDKFKGSLSAQQACDAMAAGIRRVDTKIELDRCPMADGGEGIVTALVSATHGRCITRRVTGPLPDMKVDATFGMFADNTAVVEMSAASGLALLAEQERDPFKTTTYGTGELLMEAVKLGAQRIILGIGGSATVDGGIGCAQACGLPVILDQEATADPREPLVGADLPRVVLIKHGRGSPIDRVEILVACDVSNPLFGSNGAARIFGPQKGATPRQVEELDEWLQRLAQRCEKLEEAKAPGAGAAGGLGFALLAFFGAKLRPGFELVAEILHLRERLTSADLCITGEGALDSSSLGGKAPLGVARMCKGLNVPCIALAGSVDHAQDFYSEGITAFFPICDRPMDLQSASSGAAKLLSTTAENAVRLWCAHSP